MAESELELHPNWKALASIHLRYKIFKKASETIESGFKPDQQNNKHLQFAEETSKVYQDIIEIPSVISTKKPRRKKLYSVKSQRICVDKQLFFRAAANNDADTIEKIFRADRACIHWCDSFHWTALMMAAAEGANLSFRKLLDRGANILARDKTGLTSECIAKSKNKHHILEEIKTFTQSQKDVIELSDEESFVEDRCLIYCGVCKMKFQEATLKEHTASTLHLFNSRSSINTKRKSFGISCKNRGYKMMVKNGWDQQSGLGSSKQGQLFPIKTVLRRKKTGLGVKQTPAKVTHFKPHDVQSINHIPPTHFPNKKEINEDFTNDKRLEIFLRQELS